MISVCMATFNGEKYIEKQLSSILKQLSSEDEVIISDDGSTDQTRNIIKHFNDHRIKLIVGRQQGLIKNFENALNKVKGDVIFLSDQDDIWCDNKVERSIQALNFCDLVVSNRLTINSFDKVINQNVISKPGTTGLLGNLIKNNYMGCAMAFNKKMLAHALPFPERIGMHDWWLGLVAEYYGTTLFIQDKLLLYRRHENNASQTGEVSATSKLQQVIWRVNMLAALLGRICQRGSIAK